MGWSGYKYLESHKIKVITIIILQDSLKYLILKKY